MYIWAETFESVTTTLVATLELDQDLAFWDFRPPFGLQRDSAIDASST